MVRRKKNDPTPVAGSTAGMPHVYEGPEVLTSLLLRAGSPLSAAEVAKRFQQGIETAQERSEVIPELFPQEPHFADPDEARRLYGNLFGLWDRVKRGQGAGDDVPVPLATEPAVLEEAEPLPPLPPRGSVTGDRLTPEMVEAVWKHLAALPEREIRRRQDRFTHVQGDLNAWLDEIALPVSGLASARHLAYEIWSIFDHAFADRLESADWRELKALENEPPPMENEQPALAVYVSEMLDIQADEDSDFNELARAQVERALASISAVLTRSVVPGTSAS